MAAECHVEEGPSLGDIGALGREGKGPLELCVPPCSAGGTRDGVTAQWLSP